MTTIPADLARRHLASLWPAPARFAVIGPGGDADGDAGLVSRARGLLAELPETARVVRDEDVIVVRDGVDGAALAAEVPGAVLPGLLEADLLALTSAPA